MAQGQGSAETMPIVMIYYHVGAGMGILSMQGTMLACWADAAAGWWAWKPGVGQ